MRKITLPAPPSSSFTATDSASRSSTASKASSNAWFSSLFTGNSAASPLDAAFLLRVARTSAWFGIVLTMLTASVTRSAFAAISVAVGVALSVAMLASQAVFVKKWAQSKLNQTESKSRFPMWTLLPAKYLAMFGFVGVVIHFNLVNPIGFVIGVSVVQFVIVAKVVGRMMAKSRPTIREAYVEKARNVR